MKKKIAVFASGWGSSILSQYMNGLSQALKNEPADTYLFLAYPLPGYSDENNKGQFAIFNLPDLSEFDGAVIFANSIDSENINSELVTRCHKAGIPVIGHGRDLTGTYSVVVNNYDGMCELVEHLVSVHHVKKVVYMAGTRNSPDSNERLRATRDTLAKYNLELGLSDIIYTEFDNSKAHDSTVQYIKDNDIPDAIVCVNDGISMAVSLALDELGITVPNNVIVTGFDCLKEGQIFYPSLTTINQHFTHLGKESGKLLSALLAGNFCSKKKEISCHFSLGESCGCQDVEVNDALRRKAGRDAFALRTLNDSIERKFGGIEGAFNGAQDYEHLFSDILNLYKTNSEYEGKNFHFLIDPMLGESVKSNTNELHCGFFSNEMDVVCSIVDGVILPQSKMPTSQLIPAISQTDDTHMYVFIPLHDNGYMLGYLIFSDDVDIIDSRSIQRYQSKACNAMNAFRKNQEMAHLNAELVKLSQLDALTSVKSRTAFFSREIELEERIKTDKNFEFAFAMFDINNLKIVNDTLGHDAGDQYIKNCCKLICDTFKYSSVYRIGGDEFVAVLTSKDYRDMNRLFEQFEKSLEQYNREDIPPEERISIAHGVCVYNPKESDTIQDILKTADARMYENKKIMKGGDVR